MTAPWEINPAPIEFGERYEHRHHIVEELSPDAEGYPRFACLTCRRKYKVRVGRVVRWIMRWINEEG